MNNGANGWAYSYNVQEELYKYLAGHSEEKADNPAQQILDCYKQNSDALHKFIDDFLSR